MRYSIAVMAGGQSRRFGTDKTLSLLMNKPLIHHVLDRFQDETDDLFVVAKEISKYAHLGFKTVVDSYDQQCPLVGIITALNYATHTSCLVLPADSPFFNIRISRLLSDELTDAYDAVIPVINDKTYPLTGMYRTSMKKELESYYQRREYKLFHILRDFKVKYIDESMICEIDPSFYSFININTKADMDQAQAIFKTLSGHNK